MTFELGIIGAGNMAEAIARGVVNSGVLLPSSILAADPTPQRRELFTSQIGIHAIDDNVAVARQSQALLLSVKPQQMQTALAGMGEVMSVDTLVISIAAGISTSFIEKHLGQNKPWRVVRAMPNTPMLVGEGATGLCRGKHATNDDLITARRYFESASVVIDVTEDKINAVTAVSGSGPAYIYYLVEQMNAAGIELGLSPEESRVLAIQTAYGSAKMLETSSDSPQELRRKVTSPAGTTHAAISHMESHGMARIIVDALKAADQRGRELGQ
jgi:pyrroline-5-carboxylate reductase